MNRRFNLVRNSLDVDLCQLPLLPQPSQQPAQTWAQVLLGILLDSGEVLTQANGLRRKGDAMLQQKATNLVDRSGATLNESIPQAVPACVCCDEMRSTLA